MKRHIAILLTVLMLFMSAAACAEGAVPQVSANLFLSAKQALVYLASGEYERLVTLLPFSGVAPGASEWQGFAEGNFMTLSGETPVQTEYSVAYWTGIDWKLAVPVYAPDNGNVEALVLTTSDGMTFSGYRYCKWSEVMPEYEAAAYVTWNKEYVGAAPMISVD